VLNDIQGKYKIFDYSSCDILRSPYGTNHTDVVIKIEKTSLLSHLGIFITKYYHFNETFLSCKITVQYYHRLFMMYAALQDISC
jgi:hypothetical protein